APAVCLDPRFMVRQPLRNSARLNALSRLASQALNAASTAGGTGSARRVAAGRVAVAVDTAGVAGFGATCAEAALAAMATATARAMRGRGLTCGCGLMPEPPRWGSPLRRWSGR